MKANFLRTDTDSAARNAGLVEVFFEDFHPNRECRQIGLVQVTGGDGDSEHEILERLKYEAWTQGADAILSVKRGTESRTRGLLFIDKSETVYTASAYSGVAVKYLEQDYQVPRVDSVMLKKVPEQMDGEVNETGAWVIIGVVGGLGLLALYLMDAVQ